MLVAAPARCVPDPKMDPDVTAEFTFFVENQKYQHIVIQEPAIASRRGNSLGRSVAMESVKASGGKGCGRFLVTNRNNMVHLWDLKSPEAPLLLSCVTAPSLPTSVSLHRESATEKFLHVAVTCIRGEVVCFNARADPETLGRKSGVSRAITPGITPKESPTPIEGQHPQLEASKGNKNSSDPTLAGKGKRVDPQNVKDRLEATGATIDPESAPTSPTKKSKKSKGKKRPWWSVFRGRGKGANGGSVPESGDSSASIVSPGSSVDPVGENLGDGGKEGGDSVLLIGGGRGKKKNSVDHISGVPGAPSSDLQNLQGGGTRIFNAGKRALGGSGSTCGSWFPGGRHVLAVGGGGVSNVGHGTGPPGRRSGGGILIYDTSLPASHTTAAPPIPTEYPGEPPCLPLDIDNLEIPRGSKAPVWVRAAWFPSEKTTKSPHNNPVGFIGLWGASVVACAQGHGGVGEKEGEAPVASNSNPTAPKLPAPATARNDPGDFSVTPRGELDGLGGTVEEEGEDEEDECEDGEILGVGASKPMRVRCLKFSPTDPTLLAVGCEEGCVVLLRVCGVDSPPGDSSSRSNNGGRGGREGGRGLAGRSPAGPTPPPSATPAVSLSGVSVHNHTSGHGKEVDTSPVDGESVRVQVLGVLHTYYGGVTCLEWSCDGCHVLAGAQDDTVTVWRVEVPTASSFTMMSATFGATGIPFGRGMNSPVGVGAASSLGGGSKATGSVSESPCEPGITATVIARAIGHSSYPTSIVVDHLNSNSSRVRFATSGQDGCMKLFDLSVERLHRPRAASIIHQQLQRKSSFSFKSSGRDSPVSVGGEPVGKGLSLHHCLVPALLNSDCLVLEAIATYAPDRVPLTGISLCDGHILCAAATGTFHVISPEGASRQENSGKNKLKFMKSPRAVKDQLQTLFDPLPQGGQFFLPLPQEPPHHQ